MRLILFWGLAVFAFGLTGCETASSSKNAEFVKTINFSNLNTFHYKHTLTAGMSFRDSEEIMLENLSEEVLTNEFAARGFQTVAEGDFFVVTKWRKAVSAYSSAFDSIDGPSASIHRNRESAYRVQPRVSVIVEVYESATGNLFWRNEMHNAFDAIQFTEDRITRTLQRAVQNFPQRIEKDPNLPSIQ